MHISALQTSNNKFVLAGFDQVTQVADQFHLHLDTQEGQNSLTYFKTLLTTLLSKPASGIILDPTFGFNSLEFKDPHTGLAFRLIDDWSNKKNHDDQPQIIKDWGVEEAASNYATAKLEIYYHPEEEKALEKKQLVNEIKDFCEHEGVDLFLILRIFNPTGGVLPESNHPQIQLQAVQEFAKSCDLMGIEYPGDILSCATITAELDIPWVLVSHRETKRESYDTLKKRLREVLENGASGIYASHVLWQDLNEFSQDDSSIDWDKVTSFLETTASDRLTELKRIVEES